jgi:hypothetical protein
VIGANNEPVTTRRSGRAGVALRRAATLGVAARSATSMTRPALGQTYDWPSSRFLARGSRGGAFMAADVRTGLDRLADAWRWAAAWSWPRLVNYANAALPLCARATVAAWSGAVGMVMCRSGWWA